MSRLSTFNVRIGRTAGTVGEGEYLLYQLDAERFGTMLRIPPGTEIAALWLEGETEARALRSTLRTRIATNHDPE